MLMGLHLLALKLKLILAAVTYGTSPLVTATVMFLLTIPFNTRNIGRVCSNAFVASRLFIFRFGVIMFEDEQLVGTNEFVPRHTSLSSQQACKLLSIGGRLVAYGTIATNSDGTTYKDMIDEVEDWDAELFGVISKTFRHTDIGDTIEWPTILTRLL
ncbi:hypothetical protein FRX31_014476 [Thalictrum thalictroides]|uniref:Uncharacterized protein n=1 Tax=Thalictrum thalictroides TaxID=46969 RepID=A0A7J6WEQ5_THATH|nr:hypothetical protein FRX31_014476 [Thalictrum thalictroides]